MKANRLSDIFRSRRLAKYQRQFNRLKKDFNTYLNKPRLALRDREIEIHKAGFSKYSLRALLSGKGIQEIIISDCRKLEKKVLKLGDAGQVLAIEISSFLNENGSTVRGILDSNKVKNNMLLRDILDRQGRSITQPDTLWDPNKDFPPRDQF